MLHEFLFFNHDAIIEATRAKGERRPEPRLSMDALRNGVPLFLAQVSETLRLETSGPGAAASSAAIANSATKHGADLLTLGFNVSEVVHFYGDICQAVTELAVEQNAPVTVDEFRILNRSLDTAIAKAVTEHARLTADKTSQGETERLGQLAHELRNHVHTALVAFNILKGGTVAANGSTGTVLGRSLTSLRALIESTVSEVRLAAANQPRERITVQNFLTDVAASAGLLSDHHETQFSVEPVDSALAVEGDPQLLALAVMNLLQNAFKFSRPGGLVVLRSRGDGSRVIIEIEDECGGISQSEDVFRAFVERRGRDRSGLGLGLSIGLQAVRAHGGDMHVRNIPGKGCVFSIDLPMAANLTTASA